jgi:hypothetical protein
MALITGSANVSIDPVTAQFAPQISGLNAGEALKAGAFCFVASDGDVEETDIASGSSTLGVTARQVNSGEPVTLFGVGTRIGRFSAGMTPGTLLFLSATDPGSLEDAATACDKKGSALVVSATDIVVTRADGRIGYSE